MAATEKIKDSGARGLTETLRRIIEAAEIEFGARGLDGAKVEHIAKRAGVSKQLIYHYFDGKDELYGEVLSHIEKLALQRLLTVDYEELSPEEAVRAYVLALFDQYRAHPVGSVVTLDQGLHLGAQIKVNRQPEKMQKEWKDRLAKVIERGKLAGVFHPEVDAERIHFTSVVIITGCISSRAMFLRYLRSQADLEEDLGQLRNYAADFILRGLRP